MKFIFVQTSEIRVCFTVLSKYDTTFHYFNMQSFVLSNQENQSNLLICDFNDKYDIISY